MKAKVAQFPWPLELQFSPTRDGVVLSAPMVSTPWLSSARAPFPRRYYLSGSDAFRLKLMLPLPPERAQELQDEQLVAAELDRMRLAAETSRSGEQPEGDGLENQTQGCESLQVQGHKIGGAAGEAAAVATPSLSKDLSSLPRKKHAKNKSRRTKT